MLTNRDVTRVSWRLACVLGSFVVAIASCGETGAPGGTGGTGGTGGAAATGGFAGVGGTGGDGTSGSGGVPPCTTAADCDDGHECTASACNDGMCQFASVADGTACDDDRECTASACNNGRCLSVSPEYGDGVRCDEDDENECTLGTCVPTVFGIYCVSTQVADGTACGDDAGTCDRGTCKVACTEQGIRDAIAAGGGPYTFDCDGSATIVTEAEIVIDNDVILDGEGELTVDGDEDHRVFSVSKGVTAELRGFLVTGAARRDSGPGGGIWNDGALTLTNSTVSGNIGYESGGIANSGTLTLTNSTVSGNGASQGGGITNSGTLTLTNSTVSGNRSVGETLRGAAGGGIDNIAGTLTLTNSTVSGNSSYGAGGGILNGNNGALTLTNSTVSGNSAYYGGAGIYNLGTLTLTNSTVSGNTAELDGGGGIANFGTLTLTNTLVDNDCDGTALSGGGNLESPGNTCGLDQPTDVTEVTAEALQLAPLQDNGGPTQTHALLPGSVAIDVIPETTCEVDTDQRGVTRPQGAACDVGAFELQ